MNSSASQLASTIVRFGRKPPRSSVPRLRASSISARGSARRVHASEHPRVAVVAEDDLLLGLLRPADPADDGLDLPHGAVDADHHADRRCAAAGAIRDGQPAAPGRRHLGSAERLEDHPRVPIRQRDADDLRDRDCFFRRNSSGARDGGPAGRQRVAGNQEIERDAAALDVAFGPPRARRIRLPLAESIVRRVRVDEDAGQAALLRRQRLEPAIAVGHGVADERDLAPEIDALGGQPVVVLRVPAAGVDDLAGDVAGCRERVVRGARDPASYRDRRPRRLPSATPARASAPSSPRAPPGDTATGRRA